MLTFMEFLARHQFFNEDVENPIWLFNKEYIELPVIHNQVLSDDEDRDLKHFVHDYLQNFQRQAKEIENMKLKYNKDINHKVADIYTKLSFGMVPRDDNFMFCYDNNTSIMFQPKDMSEKVVEMILITYWQKHLNL